MNTKKSNVSTYMTKTVTDIVMCVIPNFQCDRLKAKLGFDILCIKEYDCP